MESLKMPMREIREKFTKSELAILGWASAEQAFFMRRHRSTPVGGDKGLYGSTNAQNEVSMGRPTPAEEVLEQRLGPTVVEKMVDKQGNIDLRQLTGDQTLHYLRSIGVNIAPRLTFGG
jgi:hypothetical protein